MKKEAFTLAPGMRFGRLVLTGEARSERRPYKTRNYTQVYYEARCDCGRTAWVMKASLKSGSTKSCGCIRQELSAKRMNNRNARPVP